MQIAIDGPAGAGKSTVAKEIAAKLNIAYLDTGAMYRATALYMLNSGIDPNDEKGVEGALKNVKLEIKYENGIQKIYLCGSDVTQKIRENHMSKAASDVSKHKAVRLFLVDMQRVIASKCDCILDGRDIGTYVLQNAEYKFYLTADAEERAMRRTKEMHEKNMPADFSQILAEIKQRDYNDMHRDFAPLKQAEDAVLVDSTHMTAKEVIEFIIGRINK